MLYRPRFFCIHIYSNVHYAYTYMSCIFTRRLFIYFLFRSSEPSSPTSNCSLSPRLDHTTSSLAKLLKAEPICNYDGGGDTEHRSNGGGASSNLNSNNGGGGATKHSNSFGNNCNSLADRNYSNVGTFKTVAYHRNVNVVTEMKRRTNQTVKKGEYECDRSPVVMMMLRNSGAIAFL